MRKRFRVEMPAELLAMDPEPFQAAMEGFVGTVWVESPADWMKNTAAIGGEHDSDHAGSQAAVALLVDLVRTAHG